MKLIVIGFIFSVTSSAFAFPTYNCTKMDSNGAKTEIIVVHQSSQAGAKANTQPSEDGSYELSHNFFTDKVMIGLRPNGSQISNLRAVGDASAGVDIISLSAAETISVSCKLTSL
jgi:hypothetical protein